MTHTHDRQHRAILRGIARRAMLERGLLPDFPPQALVEVDGINGPATRTEESTQDLRHLVWCSIDNDDSRDLDQLTAAEAMPGGSARILVAIADVDAIVKKKSALDRYARHNTTSVYTGALTFPMLPEILSTDLTSLNYESDRLAIVVEKVIAALGRRLPRDTILRLYEKGRFQPDQNPQVLTGLFGACKPALSLEEAQQIEAILDLIEGRDCGACGSPDCLTFAEDVVRGNAALTDCIWLQACQQKKILTPLDTPADDGRGEK